MTSSPTFFDLVVLSLAVWELLEIWRHGELFATMLERLRNSNGFFARLLRCGFCLAPWLACSLAPLWFWSSRVDVGWASLPAIAVFGFAVARAANLGNDLTHAFCRTPRFTLEDEDVGDTDETTITADAVGTTTERRKDETPV